MEEVTYLLHGEVDEVVGGGSDGRDGGGLRSGHRRGSGGRSDRGRHHHQRLPDVLRDRNSVVVRRQARGLHGVARVARDGEVGLLVRVRGALALRVVVELGLADGVYAESWSKREENYELWPCLYLGFGANLLADTFAVNKVEEFPLT